MEHFGLHKECPSPQMKEEKMPRDPSSTLHIDEVPMQTNVHPDSNSKYVLNSGEIRKVEIRLLCSATIW